MRTGRRLILSCALAGLTTIALATAPATVARGAETVVSTFDRELPFPETNCETEGTSIADDVRVGDRIRGTLYPPVGEGSFAAVSTGTFFDETIPQIAEARAGGAPVAFDVAASTAGPLRACSYQGEGARVTGSVSRNAGKLTVDAGADQTITGTSRPVTLTGRVVRDGRPDTAAVTGWETVSGPGTTSFASQTPQTTVQFSQPGTYVLRLTANDGTARASDDVTVTVRGADQFRVELQAWIPQARIVDPWHPVPATFPVNTPDSWSACGRTFSRLEQSSSFRGDGHTGYAGSKRVLSAVEFGWDGEKISDFDRDRAGDATARDWTLKVQAPLQASSRTCTTTATATGGNSGLTIGPNAFALDYQLSNPLITPSPPIDGQLTGTLRGSTLTLQVQTDLFPSHGFRVYRNDKLVASTVTQNASCTNTTGFPGALAVFTGLNRFGPLQRFTIDLNGASAGDVISPCRR